MKSNEVEKLRAKISAIEKFPDQNPNPVIKMAFDGSLLYANPASNYLLHAWQIELGDKLDRRLLHHALSQSTELETLEIEVKDRWYSFYIVPVPDMNFINMYGNEITASKQNTRILSALNFASSPLLLSNYRGELRFYNIATKKLFHRLYPKENRLEVRLLSHLLPNLPALNTLKYPYNVEFKINSSTIEVFVDQVEGDEEEYCIEIKDLTGLRRSQLEIQQLIHKIAAGDFTERIESHEYEGFLNQISTSINHMLDALNKALQSITTIGIDLTDNIPSLRASSVTLSSVSTEQSMASTQVVQTLGEISKELDYNVHHSQEALEVTDQAVQTGTLGQKNMLASLRMMKELNQEMAEVKKSMRQINDITFQTELLSLNAAVEAARAKEEGRGFSVVAQEVRRLAQTCAQTASKTEEVTERVTKLVQKGHVAMEETANYFQMLLNGVLTIKNSAEDIALNSKKHSQMITELHKTILEIERGSTTVQKQSSSLEHSVQSLLNQSDLLESILKQFQFREQDNNLSAMEQLELDPEMARSILRWIHKNQHRFNPGNIE